MLVYKYRGGTKEIIERDIQSLEENHFWSSCIDALNDPWETIVKSDKFQKQSKSIGWFLNQKKKSALSKVHDALMNVLDALKKAGIYSLSGNALDEILWAHYADGHKGFCIEYDLDSLLNSYSGTFFSFPIIYTKNPPDIELKDIQSKNQKLIKKLAGYKSKRWDYEQEYRITTNFPGPYYYEYDALKSIYFGLRMDNDHKNLIMKKLKGRGVKYYQVEQVHKSYKLKTKQVIDPYIHEPEYLTQIPKNIVGNNKIEFKIIKKNYAEIIKRGDLEVLLDSEISQTNLIKFSEYLKLNTCGNAKNFFIRYYLDEQQVFGNAWGAYNIINEKVSCYINEIEK
ncbi:conserved hypothetical protein [Tenacibaculum dicentrarchi]|uniref:DUF2971 domain-containing protein n=1 Tax=Tenacibaculum dicentrarchi TaxID=669041 RepID=A0ABM9NXR9_9FLAO|nr:conserved hypothetical protein [Tenacibaculum dicentrarchi]